MGAMLRFKEETGKEVSEMDGGFTDLCTYLYCCVKSGCKREGIAFDLSLMDFADAIEVGEAQSWADKINKQAAAENKADKTGDNKKK